jgi:hypothetical protein
LFLSEFDGFGASLTLAGDRKGWNGLIRTRQLTKRLMAMVGQCGFNLGAVRKGDVDYTMFFQFVSLNPIQNHTAQ